MNVEKKTSDLGAPLYVAWQITNECNLACLHCIEESGPGKAFKDELTTEQALGFIDQLVQAEVPRPFRRRAIVRPTSSNWASA